MLFISAEGFVFPSLFHMEVRGLLHSGTPERVVSHCLVNNHVKNKGARDKSSVTQGFLDSLGLKAHFYICRKSHFAFLIRHGAKNIAYL